MSIKRPTQLRVAAEMHLAQSPATKAHAHSDTKLLHELQVHQVELEMQNEQLIASNIALEQSRDRFLDFYELAPVGYLTITDKESIAEINLTGTVLLGRERKNILQHRFSSFVMPDMVDRWRSFFSGALNTDEKFDCELILSRVDGSHVHVRLDSVRLVKEGQAPVLRMVITDISQRKQVEEELLSTKARLEATLDAIPDLLFEVGLDGRIYDYHSHRSDLLAVPASAFLGTRFSDVLPPEVAEACRLAIEEALDKGRSIGRRYALSLPQGERWFELSVAHKSGTGRQDSRFILIARDITTRRTFEVMLQESEEQFRQAFAQSPIGMLLCRLDGVVFKANAAFGRMSGYDNDRIMGHRLSDLSPNASATDEERALFAKILCGEIASFSVQQEQVHKDGHVYVVQSSVSLVCSATNVPLYCLVHVEDMTERQRHQLEALAQQTLRVQEDERTRLSRELHDDVGQSLTALTLMHRQIQNSCTHGLATECLRQADEATERLMTDVRAIAYRLRPSQLDDLGLMSSLRWHLDKVARPAGLEVALSGNLGNERFPEALELCCFRVVQEALTNVLKHARASKVEVSLNRVDTKVSLALRDNGIGFDVTRHYRVPDKLRSLGLIGMRERVAALGSRLEVESSPGRGTEIRATFSVP